jgi:protein SCO1/2
MNIVKAVLLAGLLPACVAMAQKSGTLPAPVRGDFVELTSPPEIPDVLLTNQRGEAVHFSSDVLRHRIAVINVVFTTCTTICLPMGANFGKLEKLLGNRAGRDVILVSISIDPVNDTPERLRAWGEKFNEGPGWTLLTGEKREIDTVLKSIGAFSGDKVQHTSTILIGSADTGQWLRTNGLTKASRLAEIVNNLTAGPAPPATVKR